MSGATALQLRLRQPVRRWQRSNSDWFRSAARQTWQANVHTSGLVRAQVSRPRVTDGRITRRRCPLGRCLRPAAARPALRLARRWPSRLFARSHRCRRLMTCRLGNRLQATCKSNWHGRTCTLPSRRHPGALARSQWSPESSRSRCSSRHSRRSQVRCSSRVRGSRLGSRALRALQTWSPTRRPPQTPPMAMRPLAASQSQRGGNPATAWTCAWPLRSQWVSCSPLMARCGGQAKAKSRRPWPERGRTHPSTTSSSSRPSRQMSSSRTSRSSNLGRSRRPYAKNPAATQQSAAVDARRQASLQR